MKTNKYIPFTPVNLPDRQWPSKTITKAPVWCSVDLRDGNQALIDPMNLEEKLEMFQTLVDIGIKEIEVGFPSASETEYEILRMACAGMSYKQMARERYVEETTIRSQINHILRKFQKNRMKDVVALLNELHIF